jgi:hypothetical protein
MLADLVVIGPEVLNRLNPRVLKSSSGRRPESWIVLKTLLNEVYSFIRYLSPWSSLKCIAALLNLSKNVLFII